MGLGRLLLRICSAVRVRVFWGLRGREIRPRIRTIDDTLLMLALKRAGQKRTDKDD
jgi:hypothetical protein